MKLFDRQKKWEINLYSYYDHAGIVRHQIGRASCRERV